MIRRGIDLLRPEVKSLTREHWHQIDLGAYRGNGSCECEDFEHRCRRKLEMGAPPSPSTKCQHIIEAREALLNETIDRLRETLPAITPPA